MAMLSVRRLRRDVAADHQHDAEFAQRVRERQDRGGDDAGPGEGEFDGEPGAPRRHAAAGAASRTSTGMLSNARWIGYAANGTFTRIEASSRPSKLNASDWPVSAANH